MVIRIDGLNPTVLPSRDHVIPAMKDGITVKLSVGQILDILVDAAPGQLDTLNELAAALGDDPNFAATITAQLALKANATDVTAALALKQASADLTFGQCRLALDSPNIRLSRHNGRLLTIGGVHYPIPAAGIALAATGLTPSTLYYIYAYMNSGTMTLEASTTAPTVDLTTGLQVKNGDATRTLVGMARPITGPAWTDTISQRFVRSWFNRDKPRGAATYSADQTTTSPTLAELSATIRNEVLLWSDENIQANFSGWGQNSGANTSAIKIIMDNTSAELARCATGLISASNYSCAGSLAAGSTGYHWVSVAAFTSGGTFTVFGTGVIPALLNTTVV